MYDPNKELPTVAKRKPPSAGRGRKKGELNKTTATLKEAILLAGAKAGGADGLPGYLLKQANEQPVAFMSLLGRVLPLTLQGDPNNPIVTEVVMRGIRADGQG